MTQCSVYCKPEKGLHTFVEGSTENCDATVDIGVTVRYNKRVDVEALCVPPFSWFKVLSVEPAVEAKVPEAFAAKGYTKLWLYTVQLLEEQETT